jgi:hypothetical protein
VSLLKDDYRSFFNISLNSPAHSGFYLLSGVFWRFKENDQPVNKSGFPRNVLDISLVVFDPIGWEHPSGLFNHLEGRR